MPNPMTAMDIAPVTRSRRRVLAAGAALIGLVVAPSPRHAQAATPPVPAVVGQLDAAAMKLFDAAESGDWNSAHQALAAAKAAGAVVGSLEGAYSDAGGSLEHFYEVRNNLGADLIEANAALSVRDRGWLISSADRIAARAGELSLPFARRSGSAVAPRILSLLFLARQMRRALVWQDSDGFALARDDFRRTWKQLRGDLRGQPADQLRALEQALERISVARSDADLRALYTAVRALHMATG